ncbi:preprotein translocase subunit SecG [Wolbachia endosymbiont of Dirofilaria (Dirofilaria) immitis]|uniref:preprotein translocase subunit SecG n=1 Tax=Wolbachia endosymbiont of Dirofilaria (Dirofilaria) immitis TaxID=1812115 RepID=UPI00158DB272|nr:preprotein translocase subunit SecG [Wolbachia endosymbiont of Dirofilaria (Dirofilaria) immitis]QKX02310.1 preprotein translocase subunit SecG [Wolbachia endosymbiont of Dirofilaria (Dirofilaria) immitis]
MSITVLSVLQIILVIVLVILVLSRPPGSSSLSGFSNSQHGLNLMISVKPPINLLSKVTAIVVGLFIANTLLLSGLCSKNVHRKSIAERIISENKQENKFTSVPFED